LINGVARQDKGKSVRQKPRNQEAERARRARRYGTAAGRVLAELVRYGGKR